MGFVKARHHSSHAPTSTAWRRAVVRAERIRDDGPVLAEPRVDLTGRYAHRMVSSTTRRRSPKGRCSSRAAAARGYRTAYVGKWHWEYRRATCRARLGPLGELSRAGGYVDPMLNVDCTRRRCAATPPTSHRQGSMLLELAAPIPTSRSFSTSRTGGACEFIPSRVTPPLRKGAVPYPETMANTEANYRGKPRWCASSAQLAGGTSPTLAAEVRLSSTAATPRRCSRSMRHRRILDYWPAGSAGRHGRPTRATTASSLASWADRQASRVLEVDARPMWLMLRDDRRRRHGHANGSEH